MSSKEWRRYFTITAIVEVVVLIILAGLFYWGCSRELYIFVLGFFWGSWIGTLSWVCLTLKYTRSTNHKP